MEFLWIGKEGGAMSQIGRYRVPDELKDEDLWFRFFTKRQLAIFIAVLLADWGILNITRLMHLTVVGILISIGLLVITGILVFIKMPANRYLHGGGIGLDRLIARILVKKCIPGNKVIYTQMELEE